MERIKKGHEGLSLLEMIIAMALLSTVLLASSNVMTTLMRAMINLSKSEPASQTAIIQAFEDIINKVQIANAINVSAGSITIGIDEAGTPASDADDTTYTYALYPDGTGLNDLKYISQEGSNPANAPVVLASKVVSLGFTLLDANRVEIKITAQPENAPPLILKTTIVSRCRSAQP
ncbi:MAG TPA: prepilin-type N-terminal cleavage/methylation domain-containing protein [Candidatus Omnitrophota bacterium]|nr:prepilin-type N-terminal cleavage/methylation domain-containing protein [Candidatus Omnitrophota bacterium]